MLASLDMSERSMRFGRVWFHCSVRPRCNAIDLLCARSGDSDYNEEPMVAPLAEQIL